MKKRTVYIQTTNELKIPEYKAIFDRYGIDVVRTTEKGDEIAETLVKELSVFAVLADQSNIYQHGSKLILAKGLPLERVDNVTTLRVCAKAKSGEIQFRDYDYVTEGYLDYARQAPDESVFGWDDIFVCAGTGQTYHELRKRGHKVSSRDMVVSAFLKDYVYYEKRLHLNFNLSDTNRRTIDFENSVERFVDSNEYLALAPKLRGMFASVLNSGVFFRSAQNRREKNYWWPGLNAGIPFTKKKDAIHEITYMVHDFGHFLIPDLIFTGVDSPKNRKVYVAYRMISEAVTMVLADMIFVDALCRRGVNYTFAQRKIYPLYRAMDLDSENVEDIVRVIRANIQYCLKGDSRLYSVSGEILDAFKEKYSKFFIEDYRWTTLNYDCMARHSEQFSDWWHHVSPVATKTGLVTIQELTDKIEGDNIIDQVADIVIRDRVIPALENRIEPLSSRARLARGFVRYMIGQMGLFSKFPFVRATESYRQAILGILGKEVDIDEINALRGFYEQYVDILARKNLISLDDAATYKEVYTMFEPEYAFYDEDTSYYPSLEAVSQSVFGPV